MQQQTTITQVPALAICAGLNDRTEFRAADLLALADNIRQNGLAQPPVYRRLASGEYQIIAGERRTRACRDILGWELIPAIVIEAGDDQAVAIMGAENRCRVQLNALDEALGYQSAMARFGWSSKECGERMGVSSRTVTDRLALLTLCDEARDLVRTGQLQIGYALVLATADLPRNFQNRALDLLAANGAPSLGWWRAQVSEIKSIAAQPDMFSDVAHWGQYAETVKAATVKALPVPGKTAPPIEGSTPVAVLDNQIAFWQAAAGGWAARGKAGQAAQCQAAADALSPMRDLLAALPLMAPAPDTLALEAELARVDADRAAAETLLDEAQTQIAWFQTMLAPSARKRTRAAA